MNTFIIEREKIISNAREILSRAGDSAVIAVVKGRGYGFGIDEYVPLLHGCGVRFFAVTEPCDAIEISKLALSDTDILMLRSTALHDEVSALIEHDIILTVGSYEAAVTANGIASEKGKVARVHVKIDTGMGRYGFLPDDTEQIASVFTGLQSIKAEGLYTHLTSAFKSKSVTNQQIDTLYSVKKLLSERGIDCKTVHFANSAYLFNFSGKRLGDAVRIGSAFTGRLPCKVRHSGLSRVGHLESAICELRWLKPGSKVGYGGACTVRKPVRAAVIPLGYADGFHVEKARDTYRIRDGILYMLSDLKRAALGKKTYVKINGKHARVLGHIGMTHTVCDVTDISCNIGDIATVDLNPIYVNAGIYKSYV